LIPLDESPILMGLMVYLVAHSLCFDMRGEQHYTCMEAGLPLELRLDGNGGVELLLTRLKRLKRSSFEGGRGKGNEFRGVWLPLTRERSRERVIIINNRVNGDVKKVERVTHDNHD
jgi:hypothetical protein